MMFDEKSREGLIQHKLDKAIDTIADVGFLLDNNKLVIAVNRIYYGIFYALSALALKHQFITSKHQQLMGWFNKEFVKEKKVERKYGEILHKAFDKRSKGDYDDFVNFSKDEVELLFHDMKDFIDKIKVMVLSENF